MNGGDPSHWFEAGVGLLDRGRAAEAEDAFRKALAQDPTHAKANVNLGMLLQHAGKGAEAERHYREALRADPRLAQGWFNLGTVQLDRGAIDGAADCFRRAVALDASRALWHSALGWALRQTGDAGAALASFRRAHELEPESQVFASDMLHALNDSGEAEEKIREAHLAWAGRRAAPARRAPHDNPREPARKLRVGYLAPDFSDADLASLIGPALEHRSRDAFEVLCYSDAEAESGDAWRMRPLADLWHATARMGTGQLAARIEEDRIDILVDLAGHGARGKRIPVFEQRPAPLQFTWAANPCIAGLDSIDWLTDLRRSLRNRVNSPLADARGFVAQLERFYRDAWQGYCRENASSPAPAAKIALNAVPAGLPPRVVVDGVFFQEFATGIARVWRSLFQEWDRSGFAEHVLLLDRDGTAPRIPGLRVRTVPRHAYDGLDADRAMLQAVCEEERATVFTSTYYSTPAATPVAMMVYDMIPEVLNADLNKPAWREKKHCIGRASRFVTISNSTARDLRAFYPAIPAGDITVAHVGVDPAFRPADAADIEAFRRRHGLTTPYFLLVGSRPSYKNAGTFFRAFASLPDRARYSVLCVGNMPDLDPGQLAACAGSAIQLLSLSDADLRLAYGGALALVYPSTYEGFGMPVIEALASGCPVITTSHSSLPEVAGDAAIYVDPFDHEGLARAMVRIQDPALRAALLPKGLARAKLFSWTEMARSVAAVLSRTP